MAVWDLQEKAIVLRMGDDVAVMRELVKPGTVLKYLGQKIGVRETIRPGHKVALANIPRHSPVRKYGQIIGFATKDIRVGDHIHVHNINTGDLCLDYAYATEARCTSFYPDREIPKFLGYQRADGRVGTRNYLAIISTVVCSATVARHIAERVSKGNLEEFPNVDGVIPFCHKHGCSMTLGGCDHEQLQRTLAGFAKHPNIAGYLLIGLGCEVNQAQSILESQGLLESSRRPVAQSPFINIQDSGGIQRTVEEGARRIGEMLPHANAVQRTPQPISSIILATQCGGSDANSGISANPALGFAADQLVRFGGTVILGETPEICGAEHVLTRRAKDEEVGKKLVTRIRWWEDYVRRLDAEINSNLTPGNQEGGLTTIYEKSLGAIAKGGTTTLNAVYLYGEQVMEKGLVFMDTPGNDPVSVTGMAAGGANMIAFTTGRGSVFGFKPVPSIKIASNSGLYNRMRDDMDINAGLILEGGSIEEVGRQILQEIIAVASGKGTKSEAQGVGEEELSPWILGPVL